MHVENREDRQNPAVGADVMNAASILKCDDLLNLT